MACNCKNKKTEAKKITIERERAVTPVVETSIQEINIIENMIVDINTNAEKRAYVTEFFMRNYGDPIINYCDQPCRRSLLDRLKRLKEQL